MDGPRQTIDLQIVDNSIQRSWTPEKPGIYAIDIQVSTKAEDGTPVDRTSFLTIEAYKGNLSLEKVPKTVVPILIIIGMVSIALTISFAGWIYLLDRRQRFHSSS
jgi:hypothetical protein